MRAPSWWRHFRAELRRYFWLPCDRCGEMFAGYEEPSGIILAGGGKTYTTCPDCPGYYVYRDGGPVEVGPEEFYEKLQAEREPFVIDRRTDGFTVNIGDLAPGEAVEISIPKPPEVP